MKLMAKTVKDPIISLDTNNVTIQVTGTVTAYAIQLNTTLTPLFVLNLVGHITGKSGIFDFWIFQKNTKESSVSLSTGDQRQCPSVCHWNEAGRICRLEQVSC